MREGLTVGKGKENQNGLKVHGGLPFKGCLLFYYISFHSVGKIQFV